MKRTREATAFILGFNHGKYRCEATPRQSDTLLRALIHTEPTQSEVDAFGQGSVDGAAADRFRLDLILANETPVTVALR